MSDWLHKLLGGCPLMSDWLHKLLGGCPLMCQTDCTSYWWLSTDVRLAAQAIRGLSTDVSDWLHKLLARYELAIHSHLHQSASKFSSVHLELYSIKFSADKLDSKVEKKKSYAVAGQDHRIYRSFSTSWFIL